MSLITIPTDNLYKFFSITGLLIFLASLIYIPILNDKLYRELSKYTLQIKLSTLDTTEYIKKTNKLTTEINATLSVAKSLDELQPIHDKIDAHNKEDLNEERSQIISDHAVALGNITLTTIQRNLFFMYLGSCAGALMSITGFLFWYRKLQKKQDNL